MCVICSTDSTPGKTCYCQHTPVSVEGEGEGVWVVVVLVGRMEGVGGGEGEEVEEGAISM